MRKKSITSKMMESYIADSLLMLMETKEFYTITIEEITEKAGVNRSTYYRHFGKKEDILLYFLDNLSTPLIECGSTEVLNFEEYLTKLYEHYFQHKKQLLTIHQNGMSSLLLQILQKYLGEDIHQDKHVSVQYNIAFHVGGIFNILLLWFSRDMADSPETMAKYTIAMLPENYIRHIWNKEN